MGEPEHYEDDPETCDAFVVNCSLLFTLHTRTFMTFLQITGRAWL